MQRSSSSTDAAAKTEPSGEGVPAHALPPPEVTRLADEAAGRLARI